MPHIATHRTRRTATPLRAAALAVAVGMALAAEGQDIHFSQLDVNPMLYNPAYCGFFDGDGRFGAIYRNQWATVTAPFQTVAATAEVPIVHGRGYSSGLSGGAIVSADRAGTLGYGTRAVQAVAAYYMALTGRNDCLLSLAVQGGLCQSGFDEEGIALPEGAEHFDRTRATYPTLGLGVAWFGQLSNSLSLKVGLAALNLNQPSISYLADGQTLLSRRVNLYARAEYEAWNNISVMPLLGYQHQERYNEVVYGVDVKWYVSESARHFLALSAGLAMRHADAAVITLTVERGPLAVALSYDANTSRLARASHTIGSFELGVVYRIIKPQARYRQIPCPII